MTLLVLLLLAACSGPSEPGPSDPGISSGIQGQIVDDSGNPVPFTTVTLTRETTNTTLTAQNTKSTTTDANGYYAFEHPGTGTYNLTATTNDGRGSFRASITVTSGSVITVNLEVTPLGAIQGQAIIENHPANSGGIDVYIPGTSFTAKTSPNGNFTISNVPAGTYELTASTINHEPKTIQNITVNSGQTTTLPTTITLAQPKLKADFTTVVDGAQVRVNGSASTTEVGAIISYTWKFGDGTTAIGLTASHTYTSAGEKTITLTVIDTNGSIDTITKRVSIEAATVTAGNDPQTPTTSVTLAPGEQSLIEVHVPSPTLNHGEAIYLELNQDLGLRVEWKGQAYYSSSRQRFGLTPDSATLALSTQGITINAQCRGSCVMLPSASGKALMSITNTTDTTVVSNVYAFVEDYQDTNEPNDTPEEATTLSDYDTGAIERIGDLDYFVIGRDGTLFFDSNATFEVRAYLLFSNGQHYATLDRNQTESVSAGTLVRVEALGPYAAPSAQSAYYLELQ